ncbi:MAG: cytochrome c, partial [Myxococcota bacterium]
GTVADTQIDKDNHRFRGLTKDGQWARGFPAGFELTEAKMNRGQDRYNIYCQPCHGAAGYGQGPVHKRAAQLKQTKWVQPSSFHQDYLRTQPEGKLYNTITHGIRNMPGYGYAIPVEDRWAIVAYLRALQRSQLADLKDVPASERGNLR